MGTDRWRPLPPLGATWVDGEQAYNFAIYSKHADQLALLLYDDHDFAMPRHSIPFEFPRNKTNRIWHMRVSAAMAEGTRYYGYRIGGPFDPSQGQRFNDQKIAPASFSLPAITEPLPAGRARTPGRHLLACCRACQASDRPPRPRYGHDLVIYEMHVRGFTQRDNSGVLDKAQGTFAGVFAKIPYCRFSNLIPRKGITGAT